MICNEAENDILYKTLDWFLKSESSFRPDICSRWAFNKVQYMFRQEVKMNMPNVCHKNEWNMLGREWASWAYYPTYEITVSL